MFCKNILKYCYLFRVKSIPLIGYTTISLFLIESDIHCLMPVVALVFYIFYLQCLPLISLQPLIFETTFLCFRCFPGSYSSFYDTGE